MSLRSQLEKLFHFPKRGPQDARIGWEGMDVNQLYDFGGRERVPIQSHLAQSKGN